MEALGDAEGAIPDRYLKVFKRMQEQTTRMQNLVSDLLLLTRLESCPQPQHTPVDVPALLWEVCEEAKLLDDAHVAPELKVESDVDLLGVASELRSAFSNLIVNALKYTPTGGAVVVRWREGSAGAYLDVEDTGPGIAPEHLPRLTERFYRVEVGDDAGSKGGTGLGLAIVKHVLCRHDGELKIKSELGRGSCFTCWFPEKRLIRQVAATEPPMS
jgi:two-component system phosphate regulon sensor histidine kinase PhoR